MRLGDAWKVTREVARAQAATGTAPGGGGRTTLTRDPVIGFTLANAALIATIAPFVVSVLRITFVASGDLATFSLLLVTLDPVALLLSTVASYLPALFVTGWYLTSSWIASSRLATASPAQETSTSAAPRAAQGSGSKIEGTDAKREGQSVASVNVPAGLTWLNLLLGFGAIAVIDNSSSDPGAVGAIIFVAAWFFVRVRRRRDWHTRPGSLTFFATLAFVTGTSLYAPNWLAAEDITTKTENAPQSYYILAENDDSLTVLPLDRNSVRYIRKGDVTRRVICNPDRTPNYLPFVGANSRSTPKCQARD